MSAENLESITLGADVGGKDAHTATHEHVLILRKLLRQECQGPYSQTIKQIAIVLRIDGSVQAWGKSGVETVAIQRKNTFATADIFVPREAWSTANSQELRHFLADGVKTAIERISKSAQDRGISLSHEGLQHDVGSAIDKFLAL